MKEIIQGDCLEVLKTMPKNSIDTLITDPPYGLSFMGKKWDYDVPSVEIWKECLRVLKPGGTALIFAGSRTQHRMAVNVEDAGFILKDCIMYLYGSGFPKATDIPKQLKKKCTCGIMGTDEKAKPNTKHEVRSMPNSDVSQAINSEKESGEVLQSSLSEQSAPTTILQLPDKVREGQPSMERGSDTKKSKGELQRGEVCEVSEGIFTDGEKGRLHNGAPPSNDEDVRILNDENGSSESQRPQPSKQPGGESRAMADKREPQEGRMGELCEWCKQSLAWSGFKSHGLKPAYEPILVCVKPNEGTYANNTKHGVSGLNIDGSRIGTDENLQGSSTGRADIRGGSYGNYKGNKKELGFYEQNTKGRFPANLILECICDDDLICDCTGYPKHDSWCSFRKNKKKSHTNPECPCYMLDEQSGESKSIPTKWKGFSGEGSNDGWKRKSHTKEVESNYNDKGGASRFFYCAKSSKAERNAGCEGLEEKTGAQATGRKEGSKGLVMDGRVNNPYAGASGTYSKTNHHPTVKPLKLMEYLCTLTKTPTGGIVLDCFAGSGTTGLAAKRTGRDFILIEREPEYCKIARARIENEPKTLL